MFGFLDFRNFKNPVLISSSSKSPRAATHMNGCASRWEYGLPKFQNKLWNESRVMTETVQKPYHFNEIRDANFYIDPLIFSEYRPSEYRPQGWFLGSYLLVIRLVPD